MRSLARIINYFDDGEPHICAMEGSLEVMEYLLSLPEVVVNAIDRFIETQASIFCSFLGLDVVVLISSRVFCRVTDDSNAHSRWS